MPTRDEVGQEASEGRRWRRYHLLVPVRVTIEKLLHVSVIDSLSFRMNNGGLEVCTDTELTIGDKADLEFKPPHFDRALTLRAVVRSHKGNFYGLEFLATSATERDQLACFREILQAKVGCLDA
jgi:PilZ domain